MADLAALPRRLLKRTLQRSTVQHSHTACLAVYTVHGGIHVHVDHAGMHGYTSGFEIQWEWNQIWESDYD